MVGAGLIGASVRTVPPPTPPQPIAQAGPVATDPVPDADLDPTAEETSSPDVPVTPPDAAVGSPTPAAATPPAPAVSGTPAVPGSPAAPVAAPVALPRSAPTTISIPRIGVRAEIMTLGTNPDGTVQVPPLDQAMKAGWYSPGASPGEVGNAVVVGHVDSAQLGPAVFFNLGALVPGDAIAVVRQDGSTATFTVDEVRSYPKTAFPAEQVYGPSDVPGLRVVTCGGVFDRTAGSYLNNIVVYARMTA
ncbi:Sortase family protein [Micromonospora sediminicola]|uniref:Sortase family protein n=2 Tax=Micromonosporaceae TaxID=28056 RepID=A0A1A9B5E6_9ACTN|nr:class F sortase [Micromonospora sp. WMMA1996]SBT64725.1 Sortase family protein [Micromonospora sediminicola]